MSLQESETKDPQQVPFLRTRELKLHQGWQWKQEDDDVGDDAASSEDIIENLLGQALRRNAVVPEPSDGCAKCQRHDENRDSPSCHEDHSSNVEFPHVARS